MSAWIELRGVGVSHRRGAELVRAVVDASLELAPGTITALLGPSGSGKSTLLDVLAGWRAPDHGAVIRHRDLRPGWRGLAVIPQDLGLLPELTVVENVSLPAIVAGRAKGQLDAAAAGAETDRATARLLAGCGLTHLADRPATMVSLGEQQRAAVARALLLGPQVVLADEPTAHQDEANGALVIELLADAAAEGAAVIVTTHDPRVADGVDRVVEMEDGRLGLSP